MLYLHTDLSASVVTEEGPAAAVVVGADGRESGTQHLPTPQQGVQQDVIVHGDEAGRGLEGKVQEMGHLNESIVQLIRRRNCLKMKSTSIQATLAYESSHLPWGGSSSSPSVSSFALSFLPESPPAFLEILPLLAS